MITSQALGALVLPATVACILFLGQKESFMGSHKFSKGTNFIVLRILIFSLIMSYTSIIYTLRSL